MNPAPGPGMSQSWNTRMWPVIALHLEHRIRVSRTTRLARSFRWVTAG